MDKLRELALAATPGPYKYVATPEGRVIEGRNELVLGFWSDGDSVALSVKDMKYLAAASPERVLALLDENERLRYFYDSIRESDRRVIEMNWQKERPDA